MNNNPLFDVIRYEIKSNDVVVFVKGIKEFPLSAASAYVIELLELLSIKYKLIDVAQDFSMQEAILAFAEWPRIPIVYVKQVFLGDADVLRDMEKNGDLYRFLTQHEINYTLCDSLL